MKDFSNESKKERHLRRKAIAKTIVKRYSVFIWFPLLLIVACFISYEIGKLFLTVITRTICYPTWLIIFYGFTNICLAISIIILIIKIIKRIAEEPKRFKKRVEEEIEKERMKNK